MTSSMACILTAFASSFLQNFKQGVKSLKDECDKEGLPTDGLKSDVCLRLSLSTFARSMSQEEKEHAVLAFINTHSLSLERLLRIAESSGNEEANTILTSIVPAPTGDDTANCDKEEDTPADALLHLERDAKMGAKMVDAGKKEDETPSKADEGKVEVRKAGAEDDKIADVSKSISWSSDVVGNRNSETAVASARTPRRPGTPAEKRRRLSAPGTTPTRPNSAAKGGNRRCSAPSPGVATKSVMAAKADDTSRLPPWNQNALLEAAAEHKFRLIVVENLDGPNGKQSTLGAYTDTTNNGCSVIVYCPQPSLTGRVLIERTSFSLDGLHDTRKASALFEHEILPTLKSLVRKGGNNELLVSMLGGKASGKSTVAFGKNAGMGPFLSEDDLGIFSHLIPHEMLQLMKETSTLKGAIAKMSCVRSEIRNNGCHERLVDLLADADDGGETISTIDAVVAKSFNSATELCHLLEDAKPDNVSEDHVTSSVIIRIMVFASSSAQDPHCLVTMIDSFSHASRHVSTLLESNAKSSSDRAIYVGCVNTDIDSARKCATSIRSMQGIVDGYRDKAMKAKGEPPRISNTGRPTGRASRSTSRRPQTARPAPRRGRTTSLRSNTVLLSKQRPSTAAGKPPLRASSRKRKASTTT